MTSTDPRALIAELRTTAGLYLRRDYQTDAVIVGWIIQSGSLDTRQSGSMLCEILDLAEAGLAAQERIAELEARLRSSGDDYEDE